MTDTRSNPDGNISAPAMTPAARMIQHMLNWASSIVKKEHYLIKARRGLEIMQCYATRADTNRLKKTELNMIKKGW